MIHVLNRLYQGRFKSFPIKADDHFLTVCQARGVPPGFDRFFYATIKRHVLTNGAIRADEAAWLRRVILADRKATDAEKKLLRELKGEAARTCPEFDALIAECVA